MLPGIDRGRDKSATTLHRSRHPDAQESGDPGGKGAQRGVGRSGFQRRETLIVVDCFVVVAKANRIYKSRGEAVGLLSGHNLPRTQASEPDVTHRIRRAVWCPVEEIGTEQAVLVGELVVDARGDKVFVYDLLG